MPRRLTALHHLDAPWRSPDIEQREGRILRQGSTQIPAVGLKGECDAPRNADQILGLESRMMLAALA